MARNGQRYRKEEHLSLRGAEVAVGGNGKRGDRKLDLTSAVGRRFPPHRATKRLVYGILDECERILRRVVAHIARGWVACTPRSR